MKQKPENPMREIKIEKVVLTVRGVKEELEKGMKLLEKISRKKSAKRLATKRIPGFGIRPGMEIGAVVTLRGEESIKLLRRLLAAIENRLRKKQVADNHFSFGIKEYIEIPGEEYDREMGMRGFETTVVFARKGKRIINRKIKKGRNPERQTIRKEDIIKYMEENFRTEVI